MTELTKAASDVLAERQRQIAKGYTAEHDDEHSDGSIAKAAAAYALCGTGTPVRAEIWPWGEESFYRHGDRRTYCVMAAAMLIAEIERIDRLLEDAYENADYLNDGAE